MSWRPEDWKNPYADVKSDYDAVKTSPNELYEMFEAGADAILEALREEAEVYIDGGIESEGQTYYNERRGWLSLIPDEES